MIPEPRWGWGPTFKALGGGAALVAALSLWAWLIAFVTAAPLAGIYNARVTIQEELTDSLETEVMMAHEEIRGLWAEVRAYRDSLDKLTYMLTWSCRGCVCTHD